ncbi:hypothetical protein GDO86_018864 [Hymenochirus boettgeri]|uniref:Uncharacterized protein n=1 Tax=Hymenochirus boettgeri TaxID=247094 RepID=A0A8T2IDH1_9PIPI|nr:hypothetical protein GDO86_018864 [Hymenochirus boettgeri]
MASDGKNRNSLACKFCAKVTDRLPLHLRQACKKDAADADISMLVEEAKSKMRNVVRNLSVVSYKELSARFDSQHNLDGVVNFLEEKGSIITDKPQQTTEEADNITPPSPPPQASVSARRGMIAAGLYEKHSMKEEVLKGYVSYLQTNYSESKHEAENLARFLYFVDKDECRVGCLHNTERAVEFFNELSTHTTSGTVRNYLNGVKKFIKYIHSEKKFFEHDSSLRASLLKLQKKLDDYSKSLNEKAKDIIPEMRYVP